MQLTIPKVDRLTQFQKKKYLGLESYRKNGEPVFTPVWFVTGDSRLYVLTSGSSGKAKRIRNNPYVQVVPITPRNKLDGEWVEAEANLMHGPIFGEIKQMMDTKYGFFDKLISRLYSLVTRRRVGGDQVVIMVRPYIGG